MSTAQVKAFFETQGIADRVEIHTTATETVQHAAEVIGVTEAEIEKTMAFHTKEGPVCIAMAGDAKISNPKYRAQFHEKARMVKWDEVEEVIGHEPGGVCPFALKEGVRVYLDISLKRFTTVYAAAGAPDSTIALSIPELEKYSAFESWVDVCKDWEGETEAQDA